MVARLARVVAPDMPHHVLQRGNRRQRVFFEKQDKRKYLEFLEEKTKEYNVQVWAYCLMDNHIHLIVVPKDKDSLSRSVGETHKEYTRMINFREGWRGYLWEGRFKSFILGEKYLYRAVKYVERNPVRAGMIERAWDYEWSSAKAHVYGVSDEVLSKFYLLEEIDDWKKFLRQEDDQEILKLIRRHGEMGRPLGSKELLIKLAYKYGFDVVAKKVGRKKK